MRLSNLQDKDIINLSDGKKIGKIIDAVISDTGSIISFIIQRTKLNFIPSSSEVEVLFSDIKTIGHDVILVDMKNLK
ncbi:MAG: YlmC/YmxH family sporulation protein [Bacilli bacterium]|nr:YlmC/YmxH family sporulation protein [Bacilli bacterium]